MALLEDVKIYAKDIDEAEAQNFIDAAHIYLVNAGATKDETNALYCLAVKMLVTHWYDNRGTVIVGTTSKELELSLRSIIPQLKYCYPVVEV